MAELSVEIYSHYFLVKKISESAKKAVVDFAKQFIQYELMRDGRGWSRQPKAVFAVVKAGRTEFRFHIHTLTRFQNHVSNPPYSIKASDIEWTTVPMFDPTPIALAIREGWVPRDDQKPAIAWASLTEGPRSRLLPLPTGFGKSYIAMQVTSNRAVRTVFTFRPMFKEKWIIDLKKTFEYRDEEFMYVEGLKQVKALLQLATMGALEGIKVVVMSNKTMQLYIKRFEEVGDAMLEEGFECTPDKFYQHLQAGLKIVDEVHMDFHFNFISDLYTHVPMELALSATLMFDKPFVESMARVMFPADTRFDAIAMDKYISSHAVIFRFEKPQSIRTTEYGMSSYSHYAVEKSLMNQTLTLQRYFDMINTVLKHSYMANYKPEQKCLVYCASIAMCTKLANFLAMMYPEKRVTRYVEDDNYDEFLAADIAVSTIGSAGTNVDIPNLTTVILTVGVKSTAANLQGFGRLRKLKDGTVPHFYYLVCEDIPKHIEYHEKKKPLLIERSVNFKVEYYGQYV